MFLTFFATATGEVREMTFFNFLSLFTEYFLNTFVLYHSTTCYDIKSMQDI